MKPGNCWTNANDTEGGLLMTATALPEHPEIVHSLPGRVRVHLADLDSRTEGWIGYKLRGLPGVRKVNVNQLTGNVLVCYDPSVTDQAAVLGGLKSLGVPPAEAKFEKWEAAEVRPERRGESNIARIPVPGLDTNPAAARALERRLETLPGVRASASPLTGRMVVEWSDSGVTVDDLLFEISRAGLGLPSPAATARYPANREPLLPGITRLGGATLGLAFLVARRILGMTGPPLASAAPLLVADLVSVLRSFSLTRNGLRRLMGREASDTVFSSTHNLSLAAAGLPTGLVLNQAEGLRQTTEATSRRASWRRYEQSVRPNHSLRPGNVVHAEAGEGFPFEALVREGTGTTMGRDGLPLSLVSGSLVPGGATLYGGPFSLELRDPESFTPEPRPAPEHASFLSRYLRGSEVASFAFALLRGLVTRSPAQAYNALLMVNSRVALVGSEGADSGAAARVSRANGVIMGTRRVRLPDALVLDHPALLLRGYEATGILPLSERLSEGDLISLAKGISIASENPWGPLFPATIPAEMNEGRFDGSRATARADGVAYSMGPPDDSVPAAVKQPFQQRGEYLLAIQSEIDPHPLGLIALRPRLSDDLHELVETCERHGVAIVLISQGESGAPEALAQRAGVMLAHQARAVPLIRAFQSHRKVVAFVSDHANAGAGFAASDLAIGLANGDIEFPARADVLVTDLAGLSAVIDAGGRRQRAVRDSTFLSILTNVAGIAGGFFVQSFGRLAINITSVGALAALAVGWLRLRGGRQARSATRLVDPMPERWGRRTVGEVLNTLGSRTTGLTSTEAAQRYIATPVHSNRHRLFDAVMEQIRSPLVGIMAGGAVLSLVAGNVIDVLIIGATIAFNVVVGAWQEHQADSTMQALEQMGTPTARVLRDGEAVIIRGEEIVPGDVLVLAPGDRVAADARMLPGRGVEADEAVLTGESLPVYKRSEGASASVRIVLAGSDITSGNGQAVVFAVGPDTRLGATAAALDLKDEDHNPLATRLTRMLNLALPVSIGAGCVVLVSGILRGQPLWAQLAIGASVAISAIPEGLPLLSKISESAVARRLNQKNALVRRLSVVEALGRVDIACADKTGTLTEGRLALRTVCTIDEDAPLPGEMSDAIRDVLLTAALASPPADGPDPVTHPTDMAVINGARAAGIYNGTEVEREMVVPFDPARGFHAALVQGKVCVKGAPEVLVRYCDRVRRNGEDIQFEQADRERILGHSQELAKQGLRVLMVAQGPADMPPEEPQNMVALGLLGISDPLRASVPAAVQRCLEAGIRVIMITGDHPETARTVGRSAGLLNGTAGVISGDEFRELDNAELDRRLQTATVVARATPLDKVRIVESLQRSGYTVAMTGDGANDAPALRLADVGVAMGNGTEVAKQAADVVLADNDFANIVEILVEGRSFWQRIRRATGLLVGGNLGELVLIAGLSVMGQAAPLNTRQILAINMISDVLPALAIGLEGPEHRQLSSLAREGESSMRGSLSRDILRRGLATAIPAIGAYYAAMVFGAPAARAVGFVSIVATQLTQTLDSGVSGIRVSRPVLGAVVFSAALLFSSILFSPLRNLLALSLIPPQGWALVGLAALAAVLLSRGLSLVPGIRHDQPVPAPAQA
jgi:calcium-translocating P-type ATPase